MKVKSESEVVSDPMDCSLPASSIHGIFQARVLEWGAIAFSEIPSQSASKLSRSSETRRVRNCPSPEEVKETR